MTEPAETGEKKGRRRWWRWILWPIVAVLFLPVILVLLLQLSGVQSYLRDQGESYLRKKLHTKVQIGYLRVRWWQYLELRNVYVADTSNQALFYTGSLKVHYNLLSLIGNELKIDKLEWDSLIVNAYRHPTDSVFNYQFIINAFVSPATTPDTISPATGTTMQFRLKDISLRHVRVSYLDAPGGMNAVLAWDNLFVDPDDLLIDDGVYAFRGIKLDGLRGFFRQQYIPRIPAAAAPPPPPADTNSPSLHLLLKKLQLNNSSFQYADEGSGISTTWRIGSLLLRNSNLDQDSTRIQVGDLSINNTTGVVMMLPAKDTIPAIPKDTTPNTWQVFANLVNLDHIALRYDNGPAPKAAGPDPDYNHLLLTSFASKIANLRYKPDSTAVHIKSLTASERSGFAIRKANMDVLFTPHMLALKNFLLQTNKSTFRKQIIVTVPSWSGIADNLDQLGLDASLDSVHVALGEWLPFVPDARKNKSFAPLWDKELTLSAILKGTLGTLNIKQLYLNDHNGNIIKADESQVQHATDPNQFSANLPNLYIQTGNKPLRAWLPAGTLPDTPRIPEDMLITGMFRGDMKDLVTQLQLKSEYVQANLDAHLVNITDSIRSSYTISIPYFRANPGAMLYDTTLGWVAGKLMANGQGYTLKQMTAKAAVQLDEAHYNAYTYHDVNIIAGINRGDFHVQGESADTSINANFDISGQLPDSTIRNLKVNMDLAKADLFATHWYSEPMSLKGNFVADFSTIAPEQISGNAFLTNCKITTREKEFPLDSISLTASYSDQQYITLLSPLGSLNASGQMNYTKIGTAFSNIINKPLMPEDSSRVVSVPGGQILRWNASLLWPKSLQALFPALRMDVPLVTSGRLNSDSSLLLVNAAVARISYDSLQIDSLRMFTRIRDTSIQSYVSLARMHHPSFPLQHTLLKANASTGVVDFDLLLDDENRQAKYKLGGLFSFLKDNVMQLSLKPGLLLNKQTWTVAGNNVLRIRNGAPDTANIKISHGDQAIQVSTRPDSSSVPALLANISNFKLSTITGLLATDTLLANGILNADATVHNWNQSPLVHAVLKVDSLVVRNKHMGTLNASVDNSSPDQYKLLAGLEGYGNDIKVDGTYDSTINALLNINHLNMGVMEPFTMGSLSNMSGSADGQFNISGTTSAPRVTGNLHFNKAAAMVNMIGSTLHLPDENIVIDEKGIQLNNLVIADSLNNELVVNGRINSKDFTNYRFNLDVTANNFMALGKQQNPDQWVYGPAFIDSKIKVRGTLDLPRIDAAVKLRDKSSVTMILPQDEPSLANREGIVEFVDMSKPVDSALLARQDSLKYKTTRLKGMFLSGNLDITPESVIKIVIDAQNGDYVQAKGTASINATLDPSSKLSLTGRYEISEGKYEMSLNQLIKRSFDIEKGSFISFNGDATSADLDITAKYTVNAPAYDLVAGQIQGKPADQQNMYKQRMPFLVYLMIKGSLLKPDISFRLDLPEKDRNTLNGTPYNRLKQINQSTSELNKQVMGLLVLNTFVPDDPMSTLSGGTGGGVGQAAKNSVSKILSQQLNNLAGNLIKGVDLNFDLQNKEDYSSGSAQESTNLNIGASKQLFNDRLSVSVGSNIMLQGNQQNASSLIGDISVEYKLTRDGRYRIRVYQRNDGQMVIQGQVVETGVAFALVMDYDEFREILQRSKSDKKKDRLRDNKKTNKNSATPDAKSK
ncbi:translocation/assembly module TamB domain-containing protein [Chitinophaga sp. 212800010-3]|uniref:translocation/assembly module TamB domain-containing protein n=1 Tax=unclassified Chitinophaga TaxID=2619133 RepID=UPI002DEF7B5F|nr:AsmA family protein [Chitinophaga sp. 212800010-3]